MKALLLGTGAADYDWSNYGQEDVRGSTCTLLDGHILIDCGITAVDALKRFGIPLTAIDTILITHSHNDHFYRPSLRAIAEATNHLTLYASPEVIRKIPEDYRLNAVPVSPGSVFSRGTYQITALRANHPTQLPDEQSLHYCFQSPEGNLLYALDGSAMFKDEFQMIRKMHFDWIIIDCTLCDSGDERIFEHADIDMIDHLMKTFRNEHMIDEESRIILDHLARFPWPPTETERQAKISHTNFELAHDGMILER